MSYVSTQRPTIRSIFSNRVKYSAAILEHSTKRNISAKRWLSVSRKDASDSRYRTARLVEFSNVANASSTKTLAVNGGVSSIRRRSSAPDILATVVVHDVEAKIV